MDIGTTLTQRASTYGSFTTQSWISMSIKKIMRETSTWNNLAPDQQEALDMIAVKISRILNGDPNFHDSWFDLEGYAKLISDRLIKDNEIQGV